MQYFFYIEISAERWKCNELYDRKCNEGLKVLFLAIGNVKTCTRGSKFGVYMKCNY